MGQDRFKIKGPEQKTVAGLIKMLRTAHPDAIVSANDIYGEGDFPITSMVFNDQHVELTGEREG